MVNMYDEGVRSSAVLPLAVHTSCAKDPGPPSVGVANQCSISLLVLSALQDIAPSIQAIMDAGIAPNPVREAMTIKVVVPK